MKEILWHGRGGQGAFTASRILGSAFVFDGDEQYALAFPSFGPERRGAPIRAFTKLDKKPIGDRSEVAKADYMIFLDETLFSERALDELKEGGKIILNTKRTFSDERIIPIDGNRIAERTLKRPITNTIMLAAFAVLSGEVSIPAVENAIRENLPERQHEKNIEAVREVAKEVAG